MTERPDDAVPDVEAFRDAIESVGRPVVTAGDVARALDVDHDAAEDALADLATGADVERLDVSNDPVIYYTSAWDTSATRERVIAFPDRRTVVADYPTQFTRARLSQFARLADRNDEGGYVYEIEREDIWGAPYDDLDSLLTTVRAVLGRRAESLEAWITDQWQRARLFRLWTHEDDYTVLEAETDELMGNVAREKLDSDLLHGPIEDDQSWVVEGAEATIKRTLYDAGYPVSDERDLDDGDDLDVTLRLPLRDYQQEWVERFLDRGSGTLVGPAGSGKTVAAMGIMDAAGGETLVLVPSRDLAEQWRDELLRQTDLDIEDVGVYHGGAKELRPVTIATYQIAGMDRHRSLFDARHWGLIVYDEAHRVPSPVHRLSADLQGTHRLGLTSSPVREDDKEADIYTLVGPPIGTDWETLFEEGYVARPSVEIRYVGWDDEDAKDEHGRATAHSARQIAATNPAKVGAVTDALDEHPDAKGLVFVEYLDQGEALADALDAPFISGETPHSKRASLYDAFRGGSEDTLIVSRVGDEGIDLPDAELAVMASGLGGSRRQGTQRAGRTMRPEGDARVVVIATRGTVEEDFARKRMRHLAAKGVEVRERVLD